jgi:TRAP-type mannitol/chloroaromatic compound transport system permease small subunit
MSKLKAIFNVVDAISQKIGKAASFLIFLIMTITTVEVVARYVFNHPTIWVWPVNRQLFGVFILFAGIYTMSKGDHIRIEILYVLIWQGSWMGWNSYTVGETASGAFRIPLYPLKLLIPIAAFLFLLEGIIVLSRRGD